MSKDLDMQIGIGYIDKRTDLHVRSSTLDLIPLEQFGLRFRGDIGGLAVGQQCTFDGGFGLYEVTRITEVDGNPKKYHIEFRRLPD